MKFLCFLFFICAIQSTLSIHVDESMPAVLLGLVKDRNSGLAKCTGAFITSDTLVTTAKCLIDETVKSKITVYLNEKKNGTLVYYKVKAFKIHENFLRDPKNNDIGLIKIKGKAPPEAIMRLPHPKMDKSSDLLYALSYKFASGNYSLTVSKVKWYSSAACTFALHYYVTRTDICVYNEKKFFLTKHDQGSPLMSIKGGKLYLMGRYTIENSENLQGAKIILYKAIFPHISWIYTNSLVVI